MKSDLTVVEISECFPNKFKPVTGEFILQHARALSELANVFVIVPLRMIPPKELFSGSISEWFPQVNKWMNSIQDAQDFTEGNLKVSFFKYFSIPKPFFESSEEDAIEFFYGKRLEQTLNQLKPDIVYCHWLRPWTKTTASIARTMNVPLIIDHHEDIPTLKKLFPGKYKKILNVMQNANGIVVHSSQNKSDLINENLNLPEIHTCYLGQNFSASTLPKKFNSSLKIACVSHLHEERKNIDVLIKSASCLKKVLDFEVLIAGEGPLRNTYEQLCSSLGLNDQIKFLGSKSREEVNSILQECDIFVLPSFPEAFGVVFIEALAKGLPVVTCKGNGGGEELKNLGYPAELVNPYSPEDLSGAIVDLYSDKKRMLLISDTGKKIVTDNFTWEKNAGSTMKVITKVIENYKRAIADVRN